MKEAAIVTAVCLLVVAAVLAVAVVIAPIR